MHDIPDQPEDPKNHEEEAINARYAEVLGSTLESDLHESNPDRSAAI